MTVKQNVELKRAISEKTIYKNLENVLLIVNDN